MQPAQEQLLSYLDRDDLTQMVVDLVNIPSPTGGEQGVAEYLATRFADIGLQVQLQEVETGRNNVIGTWPRLWRRPRPDVLGSHGLCSRDRETCSTGGGPPVDRRPRLLQHEVGFRMLLHGDQDADAGRGRAQRRCVPGWCGRRDRARSYRHPPGRGLPWGRVRSRGITSGPGGISRVIPGAYAAYDPEYGEVVNMDDLATCSSVYALTALDIFTKSLEETVGRPLSKGPVGTRSQG